MLRFIFLSSECLSYAQVFVVRTGRTGSQVLSQAVFWGDEKPFCTALLALGLIPIIHFTNASD